MTGKALTEDDIFKLLEGEKKASDPRELPEHSPLQVLIQSDDCVACARHERHVYNKVMYSLNGKPMCLPHICYYLTWILLDNDIDVNVLQRVPELPGQL